MTAAGNLDVDLDPGPLMQEHLMAFHGTLKRIAEALERLAPPAEEEEPKGVVR